MAGDHVCLVTGDELERREVVSTYVKQGLDGKDRVLCFFSEARADSMFDFLEADTRQRLVSTGQLGVASTA
ncbi:MAG: MEDS domain-containing protein, partial [Micromonosporaceae bacterium]